MARWRQLPLSWEQDTGEMGTKQPASHPTRPSHPALLTAPLVSLRRAVSTAWVMLGPDRIAAHCEAEPWTRATAALQTATSTTSTVAARSGRHSLLSRACVALEWGD